MAPSRGRRWQTARGRAIIRRIVEEKIPEWTGGLHEWQLIVVARILDGGDVLCITATGDGKSAIFAIPIIVLLEVARNPAAYPGFACQTLPVGIVIAPTKGLAANMVHELAGLNVPAYAYTSENITQARKENRNIASEIAECKWPIVIVDPEHLIDKEWEKITDSPLFRENIAFLSVDEVHLIVSWGLEFRPAFRHIGEFARGRLPSTISVFGLTATLQPGAPTRAVCKSLGFQANHFHLQRRSNERPNVQFLLYPLTHTLDGMEFPGLLSYLASGRKTIIYCASIEQCWRVYVYLLRLLPPGPRRLRRVRLYHAMCWPEENEETVALIRDDPLCQVVVATVAFGQGFNVKTLLDSIQLGVAKTVDQTLQQGGRVGRDLSTIGRAVVLAQASAYKSARTFLANGESPTTNKNSKSLTQMNHEKALMLTEEGCLIALFNKMYGNNTPGALQDCITFPRRLPCSNCLPRFIGPHPYFFPSPLLLAPRRLTPFCVTPLAAPTVDPPPAKTKLTRKMRAVAEAELLLFKAEVHKMERASDLYGYTPASSYLPNHAIASLLDNLLDLSTPADISATIPRWKHHARHGDALFKVVSELQSLFAAEFEAARLERNRKARDKRRAAAGLEDDGESDGMDTNVPEDPRPTTPVQPESRKRAVTLADTTNRSPKPKRRRETLKSMASTAQDFGPQYKPRRRGNENGDN
ncbi:P-loop containing nucleoside triphosphate hydrolase protein [Mycena rebaudengoi]|nr:P-loop containing nucleoside triphosphate hydrolase protein [Mycena rebaudengoi]